MFLITGGSKYIDVLEIALYNSILSGVSLEGTEFFYVNPLRVTDPLPTELRFPRTRQSFFTSFCCPPNLLRTLAEVGGYAYAKTDDALWLNLYGSNRIATELHQQQVVVTQDSDYPWQGNVKLTVEKAPTRPVELRLRVPAWTTLKGLRVNREQTEPSTTESGYVVIRRQWKSGDVVDFQFPLATRLIEANPLVEETANQLAVMRGPVVYCLESQDLPPESSISEVLLPRTAEFRAVQRPDLLGGITTLETEAALLPHAPWGDTLYRQVQAQSHEPVSIRMIPYYAWANRGPGEMSVWLKAGF